MTTGAGDHFIPITGVLPPWAMTIELTKRSHETDLTLSFSSGILGKVAQPNLSACFVARFIVLDSLPEIS